MAKLDDLFRFMKSQGASDLHLSSGSSPYLRLHGNMVPMNYRALTAEECQALIFEILSEKQRQQFVNELELDLAYTLEGTGRFRCNIFLQRKGMGAVFRIIPEEIKTLDQLNMPPVLKDLCREHKGLIVVTGPTGSGKSTTLAAMIEHINQTENAHILTVEDPIEFVYQNKKSLINQREVSSHTKSFGNALKAALREDPDIILVGEMRDLETISLAMTAAETGHLVFGTLHTNNAHKTVDRIIDVFPEAQQAQIRVMLSESLKAVIAQSLLPNATGNGRVAVNEILINSVAVANLIREGKTFQIPSTMQTSKGSGMMNFETHVNQLISEGRLAKEEGMAFLGKPHTTPSGGPTNQVPQTSQITKTSTLSSITPTPTGPSAIPGMPTAPPVKKKA